MLLGGAAGAAMPINRANKLGFCGATVGGGQGMVRDSTRGSYGRHSHKLDFKPYIKLISEIITYLKCQSELQRHFT